MAQNGDELSGEQKEKLKKISKKISLLAGCGVLVAGLIAGDLWLRGREAYLEAEKYMRWHNDPAQKQQTLEQEFDKRKTELERLLAKNRISQMEYQERLELAAFDREEAIKESSVKYAYIWYQTAVELFSPPESRWVRRSREKMAIAKDLWKKELTANKVPFEDYMLE